MNRMLRRLRALRSERGAALVELALVVPFLMMIMCATIDFGLAVYTLNNLTAAVREGGRFAAAKTPLVANDADVRQRVYGYISGMNNAQTAAQVQATITNTAADPVTGLLTVTITGYQFRPMTPLANLMGLQTINMNRSATFKWEYLN
jgi:Flp pilus assembly protein TadG